MYKFILGFATILLSFSVSARKLVFEGYPGKKITLAERESIVLEITKEKSKEFKVVIEKEGDKFLLENKGKVSHSKQGRKTRKKFPCFFLKTREKFLLENKGIMRRRNKLQHV